MAVHSREVRLKEDSLRKLSAKAEAMELLVQSLEAKLEEQELEVVARREEEAEDAQMLNG